MKHATHLSMHTPHSPPHPSSPDLTRSQRDFFVSPTLTQAPAPSGFRFGTWSVVKTLENKFPIKQVSAVAAESSQADRTGLDWTGQATPNGSCKSPRGLHISLMLLMRKGEERVSGALGVHRVRDTAMRARAI